MFKRSFLFNLLVIIGICFAIYFSFFGSLALITNHGSETTVPNVINRDMRVAIEELEQEGFAVIIDSTYDDSLKPFTVVSQLPEVGQHVKKGRTIFLTVNKASAPMIAMPNLNGLSFRSAVMVLASNRLALGDTISRPDIAIGAVLEQTWKGSVVRPGTMIPMGTKIDLVLGNGLGGMEFNVPDVIGMRLPEAIALLQANNLQYTALADGVITDSNTALVYMQIPNGLNELNLQNSIREGDFVDLRFKQLPSPGELDSNRTPGKYLNEQILDEGADKPNLDASKQKTTDEIKTSKDVSEKKSGNTSTIPTQSKPATGTSNTHKK